jgi:hypothetical protein
MISQWLLVDVDFMYSSALGSPRGTDSVAIGPQGTRDTLPSLVGLLDPNLHIYACTIYPPTHFEGRGDIP